PAHIGPHGAARGRDRRRSRRLGILLVFADVRRRAAFWRGVTRVGFSRSRPRTRTPQRPAFMRIVHWLFVVSVALFVSGIGFVIAGARAARQAPAVEAAAVTLTPVASV